MRRRSPDSVTDLPAGVQKGYFMLSDAKRAVLKTALEKYQPGQSEPVLVGGRNVLKPALWLMTPYRLAIGAITTASRIIGTRCARVEAFSKIRITSWVSVVVLTFRRAEAA